jgi:cytidylate kinase
MYRAMTWLALQRGIDPHDEAALAEMARDVRIDISDTPPTAGVSTIVVIAGLDASDHLRDQDVELNVSLVSRVPGVRAALVRIQRAMARQGRITMAGRDIGTVVLPDAGVKVYLDASPRVRAERRAAQLSRSGETVDVDALTDELARRDRIDSTRAASPLTPAADAEIINTDNIDVEEVVRRILNLAA